MGQPPEATIQITVTRPDGVADVCPVSPPDGSGTCGKLKNADEGGLFFDYAYTLDGIEGEYTVEASDADGHTATTTFTDNIWHCWVEYPNGGETVSGTIDVQFHADTGIWGGTVYVGYSKTGCNPGSIDAWTLIGTKEVPGWFSSDSYTVPWDTTNDVDGTNYCIGITDGEWIFTDIDTSDGVFTVDNNNEEIPEFATIALPAASILGLFLYFNRRKQRNE